MPNAKRIKTAYIPEPNPITVTGKTSFGKTFKKIFTARDMDFVIVKKPRIAQMGAVIANRILGKKFIWVQHFENPPTPNIITKSLLAQADRLHANNKKDANRLISFGIPKRKIILHYMKKA